MIEIGQVAYAAYWTAAGGKSAVTGDPLPNWPELGEEVRTAWRAVADAVLMWPRPRSGHVAWTTWLT